MVAFEANRVGVSVWGMVSSVRHRETWEVRLWMGLGRSCVWIVDGWLAKEGK